MCTRYTHLDTHICTLDYTHIRTSRHMLTHNKRLVTITLDIMCYDDLHPEDVNWREVLDLEPGEEFQCRIKEHEMDW